MTSACVRTVTEDDVFMPGLVDAEGLNISRDGDKIIVDGKINPDLIGEKPPFTNGFIEAPTGKVYYRHHADVVDYKSLLEKGKIRPFFVYCGGSAFDTDSFGDIQLLLLAPFGGLLVWDYPGYGKSEGRATVSNIQAATKALALQIDKFREHKNQLFVFWGHSLGGFVCADLASQVVNFGGVPAPLVLEASAVSSEAAIEAFSGWTPFVDIRIDPSLQGLDVVGALVGKQHHVLVLGAGKDRTLPVRLSRELSDSLREAGHKVMYRELSDANHLTIIYEFEEMPEVLNSFLYAYLEDNIELFEALHGGQDDIQDAMPSALE